MDYDEIIVMEARHGSRKGCLYIFILLTMKLTFVISVFGGSRGGLGTPLEKLVSLAGQKLELGRTEMGSLAKDYL